MRVPDRCVVDLRDWGYLIFEGFLEAEELAAAQDALWLHYPRPEECFADPAAHAWLATSQWAGLIRPPWPSWSLNRLAFHPDLLDLAERFLGSADLRLYEAELWPSTPGPSSATTEPRSSATCRSAPGTTSRRSASRPRRQHREIWLQPAHWGRPVATARAVNRQATLLTSWPG
jgi:hypothetical protein